MKKIFPYLLPLLAIAGAAYYFLVYRKKKAASSPVALQQAANAAGTTAAPPLPPPTGKPAKKGWKARLAATGKSALKTAVAQQTGGAVKL